MFTVTKTLDTLLAHGILLYDLCFILPYLNKFPKLMNMFICYWLPIGHFDQVSIRVPTLNVFVFPSLLETMVQLEACFFPRVHLAWKVHLKFAGGTWPASHGRKLRAVVRWNTAVFFWHREFVGITLSLQQVPCVKIKGPGFRRNEHVWMTTCPTVVTSQVLLTCAKDGQVRDDIWQFFVPQCEYAGS